MSLPVLVAIAGFFSVLVASVLVAWAAFSAGRWLGSREALRADREHEGPVGSVVGATLGLLAFTLAITFNMAHTKYNDRKQLVREDVKAIETAYDRAQLLPEDAMHAAHEKLVEYARIRAFDTFAHPDLPIAEIISRSERIQQELWQQAGRPEFIEPGGKRWQAWYYGRDGLTNQMLVEGRDYLPEREGWFEALFDVGSFEAQTYEYFWDLFRYAPWSVQFMTAGECRGGQALNPAALASARSASMACLKSTTGLRCSPRFM